MRRRAGVGLMLGRHRKRRATLYQHWSMFRVCWLKVLEIIVLVFY